MAIDFSNGARCAYDWTADADVLAEKLHVDDDDRDAFLRAFDRAKETFRPRVFCRAVTIDALGDDFAMLSGEWFEGARVAGLLQNATKAWMYVATAGKPPATDEAEPLEGWWTQMFGESAVHEAVSKFLAEMPVGEGEHLSTLSPGSLPDWPISEQRPLFRVLGAENAGVALTDMCLMLPRCSVSGLMFTSPRSFCQCAHCDRTQCPNRRADAMQ